MNITAQTLQELVTRNFMLKAIAFMLTLAIFLWVREDREAAITAHAPLRILYPDDMVQTSPPVEKAAITIRGRWSTLNRFDPSSLEPITVEVTAEDNGEFVSIPTESVKLPSGLEVTAIQPEYVSVELEKKAEKTVDVRPRLVGQPAEAYRIGDVEVRPSSVTIRGPASSIGEVRYAGTEPIDVTGAKEDFERKVQLRFDDPLINYDLSSPIAVSVPVITQEVQRTLQGVAVVPINTGDLVDLSPDSVGVTVRGPKATVDALTVETVRATVDLGQEATKPPGTFNKQPRITNLPPGVTLVGVYPTDILVTTRRPESLSP
jgi:YbbR domain-containing protein